MRLSLPVLGRHSLPRIRTHSLPLLGTHSLPLLAASLLLALAGCTPIPPITHIPGRPAPGRDTTAAPTRPGTPQAPIAVVDSMPSPEALAVLSTIPEPLAPGERVPPPGGAPADTAAIEGTEDDLPDSAATDTGEIPVPARTPMLGEIVNPNLMPGRDSTAAADTSRIAPPPPRPSTGSPPATSSPPRAEPAPARGSACWRVQIMAPKERDEADRKRSAAESILLVPMVIERESGLYKIRTRECFSRATADVVRGRAVASGFPGAFPLETVKR